MQSRSETPDVVTGCGPAGAVVWTVVVEVDDAEVVAVVAPGRLPKKPVEPPAYGLLTWFVAAFNDT